MSTLTTECRVSTPFRVMTNAVKKTVVYSLSQSCLGRSTDARCLLHNIANVLETFLQAAYNGVAYVSYVWGGGAAAPLVGLSTTTVRETLVNLYSNEVNRCSYPSFLCLPPFRF